jgi:hypothetical protein
VTAHCGKSREDILCPRALQVVTMRSTAFLAALGLLTCSACVSASHPASSPALSTARPSTGLPFEGDTRSNSPASGALGRTASQPAAAPWQPAPDAPSVECRRDESLDPQPGNALEAACERDPACGCAALGHALLVTSNGALDARALTLLDGACHQGVLASCREASLVTEICARGTSQPSSACEALARAGRLPEFAR